MCRPRAVVLVLALALQPAALVRAATLGGPVPASATVVATGLVNPRGFTWDIEGALYVALAGRGDNTAGIARIEGACPVPVAERVPSVRVYTSYVGTADVAFLGGDLYALVGAIGAPNGVYRIESDGGTSLVADLGAWHRANPTAFRPGDYTPAGVLHAMVADPNGRQLWVIESNQGQVLTVAPDGAVTRVADLSPGHPVPTGLTPAPGGGVYVAYLTVSPYANGAAKVVKVAPDGTVTDAWTGLTALADVAVGADGALYALELSTGNSEEPPYLRRHAGRVVRQTEPNTLDQIVAGLDQPIALNVGPDGALYVAAPAQAANDGQGTIVRLDSFTEGTTAATPAEAGSCGLPA